MGFTIDTSYITPRGMLAGAIVPTVLAIIAVMLRFYVRRMKKQDLLWDDWLLIPALACSTGMTIALITGVAGHGLGYTKGLPPGSPPEAQLVYLAPNIVLTEKVWYATQIMQIIGLGFIKTSFVLFYRRIFCVGMHDWFWFVNSALFVLSICWSIAFFFIFVFYCGTNHWAEWSTVGNVMKYCPNGVPYQTGLAVSDFIMDLMIILLPVQPVLKLKIDLRRKLLVLMVFMMGWVAVAASLTRMVVVFLQMWIGDPFDLSLDGDKIVGLFLFWSSIENGAAIVAACLLTMRPLLSRTAELLHSLQSRFALSSLRNSSSHPSVSVPDDIEYMSYAQEGQHNRT